MIILNAFNFDQSRLQHSIDHLASLTRCVLLLRVYSLDLMLFYAFVCTQHAAAVRCKHWLRTCLIIGSTLLTTYTFILSLVIICNEQFVPTWAA